MRGRAIVQVAVAALQNPGAVGMTAHLSGGVTDGPVVLRLDRPTARAGRLTRSPGAYRIPSAASVARRIAS